MAPSSRASVSPSHQHQAAGSAQQPHRAWQDEAGPLLPTRAPRPCPVSPSPRGQPCPGPPTHTGRPTGTPGGWRVMSTHGRGSWGGPVGCPCPPGRLCRGRAPRVPRDAGGAILSAAGRELGTGMGTLLNRGEERGLRFTCTEQGGGGQEGDDSCDPSPWAPPARKGAVGNHLATRRPGVGIAGGARGTQPGVGHPAREGDGPRGVPTTGSWKRGR